METFENRTIRNVVEAKNQFSANGGLIWKNWKLYRQFYSLFYIEWRKKDILYTVMCQYALVGTCIGDKTYLYSSYLNK